MKILKHRVSFYDQDSKMIILTLDNGQEIRATAPNDKVERCKTPFDLWDLIKYKVTV